MTAALAYTQAQQIKEATDNTIVDSFIEYVDVRPTTAATYRKAIKQFGIWLADNDITAPTRQDIINWRDDLKKDHKTGTVQTYLTIIKMFFIFLSNQGYYINIADHVKQPTGSSEFKRDPLTQEQAQHLLDTIDTSTLKGLRDKALVYLMLSMGLRTIEVIRADVSDIRTKGDTLVLQVQGKGRDDKSESVNMPLSVYNLVMEYLSARGAKDGEPLFTSVSNHNSNSRLTTKSVSRLVKGYLKAAGYSSDRLTAHSLRHTTATQSRLLGHSIEETQQTLRHKSAETTARYDHSLQSVLNTCTADVASLYTV